MSERGFPEDKERRIAHEETEQSEGDVLERHVVREEAFGPAEEAREPDIVHGEMVRRTNPSHFSGAQREESLDTREGRWSYTRRVLDTVGLWVGVVLAVVETLLVLRLVFAMTGANPGAGFVAFTNGSTGWMVGPFQGIAPNGSTGVGFFEPATLVGMFIYPILALLVILVLRAIAAWPRPDHSYLKHASRRRTL